jgi:hypothetical protein
LLLNIDTQGSAIEFTSRAGSPTHRSIAIVSLLARSVAESSLVLFILLALQWFSNASTVTLFLA